MPPTREPWPLWMKLVWQLLAVGVIALRGPESVQSLCLTEPVEFLQEWSSAKSWQKGRPLYSGLQDTVALDVPEYQAGERDFFIKHTAHPPGAVLLALPFVCFDYFFALWLW